MNTFLQTKLGEVLAFARIGQTTIVKGDKGFQKILEQSQIDALMNDFSEIEQEVTEFATHENALEEVEKSAKETEQKVTDMRDTYIDGEWDESDEVLEWMGFYSGAALVHWYLVSGAAESLSMDPLKEISVGAISKYSALFSADEKFLQNIGAKNAG